MKLVKDNSGKIYEEVETGIDGDGNKVKVLQRPAEWLTPTVLRQENGKQVSFDPMEYSREVYNNNNFTVVWENQHYNPDDIFRNPQKILNPPKTHAFIPHHYYVPWIEYIGNPVKEQLDIYEHYGSDMFKNLKTRVSRPEVHKKLY